MKQLNFTISDSAHEKLEKIKVEKRLSNNSEAIEFLIEQVFKRLEMKKMQVQAIRLGLDGKEMRK